MHNIKYSITLTQFLSMLLFTDRNKQNNNSNMNNMNNSNNMNNCIIINNKNRRQSYDNTVK